MWFSAPQHEGDGHAADHCKLKDSWKIDDQGLCINDDW